MDISANQEMIQLLIKLEINVLRLYKMATILQMFSSAI